MKTIVFSIVIASAIISSCGNESATTTTEKKSADSSVAETPATTTSGNATSINEMVSTYLLLKKALVADNSTEAATAGKQLQEATTNLNAESFSADQKKLYDEVKAEIIDHADHIASNGSNIAHQREHFDMLSQDVYDLVKSVKPGQALYKEHCPMFNNKKGAIWLSETKEIKNPYYGKEMLTCGEVQEEIK